MKAVRVLSGGQSEIKFTFLAREEDMRRAKDYALIIDIFTNHGEEQEGTECSTHQYSLGETDGDADSSLSLLETRQLQERRQLPVCSRHSFSTLPRRDQYEPAGSKYSSGQRTEKRGQEKKAAALAVEKKAVPNSEPLIARQAMVRPFLKQDKCKKVSSGRFAETIPTVDLHQGKASASTRRGRRGQRVKGKGQEEENRKVVPTPRAFLKLDKCKKGSSDRLADTAPTADLHQGKASASARRGRREQRGKGKAHEKENRKVVPKPRVFLKQGKCKKGDSCQLTNTTPTADLHQGKAHDSVRRGGRGHRGKREQEEVNRKLVPAPWAFHNFFLAGSTGHTLFIAHGGIRSYLSVEDLVSCAVTSRAMHKLCRTYTVHELLKIKSRAVSKQRRIALGVRMMNLVIAYHPQWATRPRRVENDNGSLFWAKLYHHEELRQVHDLIDLELSLFGTEKKASVASPSDDNQEVPPVRSDKDEKLLTLLSAFFGETGREDGYDVTRHIENLTRLSRDGRSLILTQPVVKDGRGVRAKRQPSTFRW